VNLTLELAKVALLAAAGWLVAAALARGPAGARHDLWLLVILGALVVPVAELLLPPLYVTVPPAWEAPAQPPARWLPLVLGVWVLGALAWVARLGPGLLALRRIARSGEHWRDPAALAALAAAARLAGVTRPVTLLRSSAVPVPATWGVRRPVIALPAAAATWTADRLRLVLVHELVHVRRQDVLVEGLLWVAGAVYWFHPAVWVATGRVRLERERACDEAVLATGARASDYCGHLVEIMRAATRGARGAVVGATMAAPCTLERRVRALLAGPPTAPPRPRSGIPLLLAGAVLIYALGTLAPCAAAW
jgi:beta-lactamase regulating signal transducer with metallopeptidase domain